MADYTDIGFNQFLQKQDPYPGNGGAIQMDPLQSDYQMQSMSGNKVSGGILTSNDGKFAIDLNQGAFKVNNGNATLITIGLLDDGNIGMQIKDNNGNILMEVSNNANKINSSDGHMVFDFDNNRLVFYDESNTPQAVLGNV